MKIIITLLILLIVSFFLLYGGYYFIRPSQKGEKILNDLNIPHPTIIAHRGASEFAPEQTKPAFEKAAELGVDYLEADIHKTKDGRFVVLHDNNLKRTSNIEQIYPKRAQDHISTFTYEELLKLDFGMWFNKKYPKKANENFKGVKILTLEELLEIASNSDNSTGVVLDLKEPEKYKNITRDLIGLLKEQGWYKENNGEYNSDVIIFSVNLDALKQFKDVAPEIPRVLLLNNNMITKRKWDGWLDLAENNVHGFGVKGFISWPWHIALAHDRNLFVFSYVINKNWQLNILSHIQSNGYITDRPELVLDFFNFMPEIITETDN
jgi:glycerophosphoryl diester phosphodiesterase